MKLLINFLILILHLHFIKIAKSDELNSNSTSTSNNNNTISQVQFPNATFYEARAQKTLANGAKLMQKIYNRKRDIFLSLTKGRGYNVINHGPTKQEIEHDYRRLVYELAANLSITPVEQLSNPILQRQVQRLAKLQVYGLNDEHFTKANNLLHQMQTFITMRNVCPYQRLYDCSNYLAMVPSIVTHSVRTQRLEELNYYWVKWRDNLNDRNVAKSSFIDFVRLLRIAATYNGHVTPSRTWYLYYDTDNFQRELEDVIWEIMPLYRELHAYLRHSLRQTYGNRLTEDDGAIPAPVLEQMIHQAWFPHTAFHLPYPKTALPQVQQRLEEVLVTPVKLNKKAAEFFESLGLNKLTEEFYKKFARRINEEEMGPDCKAEIFYFPPDVAIRYCPKLDYKKLMQMHGHMAELQYNIYKKQLPFGVDREPCPGFGNAIGEAAVIASGTPRHLHRLHILYNESLNEEQSMNRLFRMGVHTILAIPQYFVNEKFIVDVMDGRIGAQEYNCGYWRLQYKYAGVVSPLKRTEKNFDPDYKFYRGINPEKPNTVKLLSEILGLQFYRAFCLASGQYQPGNPEYPLHNCDFYGSEKAGDIMRQMMQLGATKHWRDVMEIATAERKLSGKGIMEYFAPLFTWLKAQNKLLDLDIGWDSEIKCSAD